MEQTFEKVMFSLIPSSGFTPDEDEQKEMDDLARKREGVFYGPTEVLRDDLKTLLFVVKDEETGEVYNVDPLLVKFKI